MARQATAPRGTRSANLRARPAALARPPDERPQTLQLPPVMTRRAAQEPRRAFALAPPDEGCRVIVKKREVVDTAHIRRVQHLFGQIVEAVEIDAGKALPRQIADPQPAAAGQRRQQTVVGIIELDRFLRIGAADDRV